MASWDKSGGFWPSWQDNKIFTVLVGILLVYLIVLTGSMIRQTLRETRFTGLADLSAPTIVVSAVGEASAVPDIATVDLGVSKIGITANAAQDENTATMNALISGLRDIGISDTDMQTSSYTLYPLYDYDVDPVEITGYEASQTLTVKIRQSELVSQVLAKAGDLGADGINALTFTVDDDTAVVGEARAEAIAEAKAQAATIAAAMGVRLGAVVDYVESQSGDTPYFSTRETYGMGGGAPDIALGQNEVEVSVSITYALY